MLTKSIEDTIEYRFRDNSRNFLRETACTSWEEGTVAVVVYNTKTMVSYDRNHEGKISEHRMTIHVFNEMLKSGEIVWILPLDNHG